jgi:predicted secreted protein
MAERTSKSGKKVVKAESAPKTEEQTAAEQDVKAETDRRVREGTGWTASPEAKKSASTKRVIAWILWIVAIILEGVGIWYILTQLRGTNVDGEPIQQPSWFLWALLGLLVVIGILTIVGSQLWKAANQADPASRQDGFRYFVQNQLGAIIPIIAFLPIILILLFSKNVDGRTKGIAGAVGAVVLVAAVLLGIDWNPNSQEAETEGVIANEGQIDEYTTIVEELTGGDAVAWTQAGKVYHLCTDTSAVNQVSADGQIFTGTVADAHAAGKEGLTLQVDQELDQCALPEPANLSEIEGEIQQLRAEVAAG